MTEVTENRRARHDYAIDQTIEAGIVLTGKEITAIRNHAVNLSGSFAKHIGGELWLVGVHIAVPEGDPTRSRKLLLHRSELRKLAHQLDADRLAMVPLKLYFKRGWAKILLGIGRRKKRSDKREDIKRQDERRALRKNKG